GTVPICAQVHILWVWSLATGQTMKKDSTPCLLLLAFVSPMSSKLLLVDDDGRTEHGRSLVALVPIAFSRTLEEVKAGTRLRHHTLPPSFEATALTPASPVSILFSSSSVCGLWCAAALRTELPVCPRNKLFPKSLPHTP